MIKPLLLFFCCLALREVLFAQHKKILSGSIQKFVTSINVDRSYLYFFCRGTKAKSGIIAQQFNLVDKKATHVGLGYFDSGKKMLFVAHMSNEKDDNGYYLRHETLQDFLSGEEVAYASAWAVIVSEKILDSVIINISLQLQCRNSLYFDEKFDIQTDSFLYCSEFCIKVLPVALQKKLIIKPTIKNLNNSLLENFLCRTKLNYYPVDFFRKIKKCRLIAMCDAGK